jgi:hypothetical protein
MGGSKGEWVIRHRDLVEFQLHDPRPMHRKSIRLPETLRHKLADVERRAWNALSRGHFQQFGHWAGVWVQLSSIDSRKPAPFGELVKFAKEKGVGHADYGKRQNMRAQPLAAVADASADGPKE